MHFTAIKSGESFADAYGEKNFTVLDIGGRNVNGSLRLYFENKQMKYICLDMDDHESVDIVCEPCTRMPFDNSSIDLIISTSCFEHDPCFWVTFKEMCRIVKPTGYIYINAPTKGDYHGHPGDNWRFYSDAGQALAFWSGFQYYSAEKIYPVKVVETFNIIGDTWNDFVCVWKKVEESEKETKITTHPEIINNIGILEKTLNDKDLQTRKRC